MPRYVLIDHKTGYIVADVGAESAEYAAWDMDTIILRAFGPKKTGNLGHSYYAVSRDDPKATYHVFVAPEDFPEVENTQSETEIARVEQNCRYDTTLVRLIDPEEEEARTKPCYILIDHKTGHIVDNVVGADSAENAASVHDSFDDFLRKKQRSYYAVSRDDPKATYHVFVAPKSFRDAKPTEIARVEQNCRYDTTLVRVIDPEGEDKADDARAFGNRGDVTRHNESHAITSMAFTRGERSMQWVQLTEITENGGKRDRKPVWVNLERIVEIRWFGDFKPPSSFEDHSTVYSGNMCQIPNDAPEEFQIEVVETPEQILANAKSMQWIQLTETVDRKPVIWVNLERIVEIEWSAGQKCAHLYSGHMCPDDDEFPDKFKIQVVETPEQILAKAKAITL
jgi:hypothetical protein